MSDYNIQMHDYNGIGYDNLYPKTKSNMVLDGDTNLETKLKYYSNPNLIDNWDFSNADNIVDQRGGKVAPPGTPLWNSADGVPASGTDGKIGTVVDYRQITITGTNSNGVAYVGYVYNNVTYYTRAEYAVRGYTGTGYGIDRWQSQSGITVSIQNGYITLKERVDFTNFYQTLNKDYSGKTLTMSCLTTDGFFAKSFVGSTTATNMAITNGTPAIYMRCYIVAGKMTCRFFAGEGASQTEILTNIIAVKLELGDTQTLCHNEGTGANPAWALNKHQKYGDELRECQRYFYVTEPIAVGAVYAEKKLDFVIKYPVTMRATPTTAFIEGNFPVYYNNSLSEVVDASKVSLVAGARNIEYATLRLTPTNSFSVGTSVFLDCHLALAPKGKVALSAEL